MNEIKPLVSVIIGAYNIEKVSTYIDSINSIINQSLKNIEIIICDDGSEDNTYQILKKFQTNDRRIILLRNEVNKGLSYTLNKCLKKAEADFIARHDLDDISVQYRLNREHLFLKQNKQYDFVGSNVALFDDNGIYAERIMIEKVKDKDFLFNNPFVHGSLMFRKTALLNVEGYRNKKWIYRNEDYDLLMRLYARGSRGYNIQKILYLFFENTQAQKRRKFKYRINECYVRYFGFKKLNILSWNWLYIIKPLIVGALPLKVLKLLQLKFIYKEKCK